jgi:bacterioferritin
MTAKVKGDPQVLEILSDVLAAELAAINQYFLHYRMCEHWGYKKLAEKKKHESIEEMRDADAIMERILYLDGIPNMMRLNPVKVGENPVEQHELDLALELAAIDRLNKGIAICVAKGDNGTRELLEGVLKGEEESADWLESQLHAIGEIGKENYLAQQLG